MSLKQYIFPIYSGGTIIGQCFLADGYLITAAHVVKDFPKCYARIKGKTFGFSGFYPNEHPIYMGEGNVHQDSKMIDVAIYPYDGINSPLKLTSYIPQEKDEFDSCSTYEAMNFSLINPPCELRMVPAIVRGEEEGNYFYCDCNQYGGSSGSPLIQGNQVIGIMHGGDGNGLCAFLRSDVVSMLISKKELSSDYDAWDLERALEYEGCTYSKDKKRLLKGTDDKILQGTIVICNEAFCRNDYKGEPYGLASGNLVIPSSVKIIGNRAFAWSKDLETVVIPDSVIQIGEEAFSSCTFLKEVILPNSISQISKGLFDWCQSLQTICLPNSVAVICESAFNTCESLRDIVIPESVKRIEDDAFGDCTSLVSVSLPKSIESIGKYSFRGCESLEQIVIPFGTMGKFEKLLPDYIEILVEEETESETVWKTYYDEAFSLKDIWDYEYPYEDKYEQIDGDVAEVVSIEPEEGGRFLRIRIPLKDGSSEELKLSPLSDLEEGDKVDVSTIVGQEFHKKGSSPIVRYDGELFLTTGVTEDDLKQAWTDELGVKYSADRRKLLETPTNLKEYTILSGAEIICDNAFSACRDLETVHFPKGIRMIGDFAFYNCVKLREAVTPQNTKFGMCVFEGCERLSGYHPFE